MILAQVILDASALLAVVLTEPDGDQYLEVIVDSERVAMSTATWLEAAMVVEDRGDAVAVARFDQFVKSAAIELMPVTVEHAEAARQAWRSFGRGNHPATLNYGDCFSYALAKTEGAALLFKGNDFSQTDIEPALKD